MTGTTLAGDKCEAKLVQLAIIKSDKMELGYFSMPIAGALAIATGWAMHKPAQLGWLERLFGGYDRARLWHFLLLWLFVAFVIPHVFLVIADGWDTFRSNACSIAADSGGADETTSITLNVIVRW